MGKLTNLTATDGVTISAYRAEPEGAPRGGVVVLQEIWGINSHIQSVTDGYAAEGYLAIAPALFDRGSPGTIMDEYNAETMQKGIECMQKVDVERGLLDVAAAVQDVSSAGKVGVVGFCFGGRMTWLASSRVEGISAAVPYYGGGIPDLASEQPRCPVMLHFGKQDSHIPLESVEEFGKAHPTLPIHLYDADHGFNCDQRDSFNEAASRLARQRTLEFFAEHLG